MARDERRAGLDRPVTLDGMQIGVADTAADELHQRLSGAGLRNENVFDNEVLAEFLDYSCLPWSSSLMSFE